jgi:tripartite-type tricarboxylate transporter receptor subunit TctC
MERGKGKSMGMLAACIAIFMTLGSTTALGDEYPSKPIKMLVGYRAGGGADTMARLLAKPLGKILGQPVAVVNKPGGGGGVAATALKNSKSDGYTLCMTTAITYSFIPHVAKVQFTADDFQYVAAVAQFQEAFVARSDKPYKSFKELVEYAKTHPGLNYASITPLDKVFLKHVAKKEGIQWTPVPVKGGAGMVPAVLGGHVDFGFSGGIHYQHVKAGKMVVLAGLGRERLLAFPDVPTLKESGYDLVLVNCNMITAPKGVPDSIVKKLAKAISEAVKDPD